MKLVNERDGFKFTWEVDSSEIKVYRNDFHVETISFVPPRPDVLFTSIIQRFNDICTVYVIYDAA